MPPVFSTRTSLETFLATDNEVSSSELLAGIITQIVDPEIKKMIRQKLHVTLQPADERLTNQDAIDLSGDVRALVIAKLQGLRSGNDNTAIEDLRAYARAVALNAVNNRLRQKHPRRLRLKNQLRYILGHDARFAIWQDQAGELLCGPASSQKPETNVLDRSELMEIATVAAGRKPSTLDPDNVLKAVTLILGRVTSGVRFRDLLSTLYELLQISEPAEVSEEHLDHQADKHAGPQAGLEQSSALKNVWGAVMELPLRHRAALLLNLKDRNGDGLITLLPLARVATIVEIARLLEFPVEDFASVWHELPWDDKRIATHLCLTRQQVINLRQSARATLRRRLKY